MPRNVRPITPLGLPPQSGARLRDATAVDVLVYSPGTPSLAAAKGWRWARPPRKESRGAKSCTGDLYPCAFRQSRNPVENPSGIAVPEVKTNNASNAPENAESFRRHLRASP